MKKQIIRIFIFSLIITFGIFYMRGQGLVLGTQAHQVGDLLFTWPGSTTHDPIFTEDDFKPGDCVTKEVDVENQGSSSSIIGVYSDGETDTDSLSSVLTIEISELGNLYGPVPLTTFAADSDILNQIPLSNLGNGDSTTYFFEVCFPDDEGNEHQGDEVTFNLKFGEIPPPIDLPAVCDDLEGIVTEVIIGTPGDDTINGTTASELIRGLGGNDRIRGKGGHDCIIGGPGEDRISGGSGNDIITGNSENDRISGGSGTDTIIAGAGDDRVNSGTGNDTVFGNSGEDRLSGSTGDDEIRGGTENDRIWGGSGHDDLRGNAGNDRIKGGSGDDLLLGGPDIDNLNGNSGTDTCVGETEISCEL